LSPPATKVAIAKFRQSSEFTEENRGFLADAHGIPASIEALTKVPGAAAFGTGIGTELSGTGQY
jgi:hypothetical protein